ncbi:MAG: hypothetical protein ABI411_00790 [Tahibacter sp.]
MAWVLVAALTSTLAIGATPSRNIEQRLSTEQLRATGLDTLSAEQLALLNRLLREESVVANVAEPQRSETAATPAFIGLDESPVRSRLKGSISGWEPGTVFELDNGEKWKVLKGSLVLPESRQTPDIEVIAGIAGRWFLQIDENLPKARVYRIQ